MSTTIDGLSYSYRKPMSNVGHRPSGALTDYTVPVRITADSVIGGRCLATGNDLRFCLSDDTLLYADKDYFSVTGGAATGLFWVKVPSVASGSDLALRCYYGNAGAGAQANPTSAYDGYYKGVYHLGDGSTLSGADSTVGGNNGTLVGSPSAIAAQIGGGAGFDGSTQYITTGTWSVGGAAARTFEAWVKRGASTAIKSLVGFGMNAQSRSNILHCNGVGAGDIYFGFNNNDYYTSGGMITTTAWHHVMAVYDGGILSVSTVHIYVDGVSKSLTHSNSQLWAPNTADQGWSIATDLLGTTRRFDGGMDEVRISNIARSAAYAAYNYTTQNAEFLTWGAEEAAGASAFRLFSFSRRGDPLAKGR